MTKIKVCGLTNLNDALFAAQKGADYLGFIFYKESPRYVSIEDISKIIAALPENVKTVGVFVNQPEEEIRQAIEACNLDYIQLHGGESPEFAENLPAPSIKTFRIKDGDSLKEIGKYDTFAFLFDTFIKDSYGGTGKTFDLSFLENRQFGKPFFLSGGLTPENVAEVIRKVKPYAVDVASGIEKGLGIKDLHKVEEFIKRVRAVS